MKDTHDFIVWEDRLKLGIPLIDRQHEKLVKLTNNLYLACLQDTKTANSNFIKTVHEVVGYVRYHFSTEEKLMLLVDFPDFSFHKNEHTDFIKQVLVQTKLFTNNSHLVPNHYVHFLKEWILSHIAVHDKAAADFILNTENHEKLELLFPGLSALNQSPGNPYNIRKDAARGYLGASAGTLYHHGQG